MGASFHEVQFPPSISLGASGGPGFHTTILTLASGSEKRNIDWAKDRGKWDVSHGLKTQAQLDELIAFFRIRRGQGYGFRFKAWEDYRLVNEGQAPALLATTDGVMATFQIQKVYQDAGGVYIRDIFKPVAGTLSLLDNGVSTVDYTVDTTTGLVTLGTALRATTGHLITGTCEFDVPARFATDDMPVSITDIDNFSWGSITVWETRDI